MRLGHRPPLFLRVQVSTNGRDWHDAALPPGGGANPTTYPSEASRLQLHAEAQGYRYIRALEESGGRVIGERWNTSSLYDLGGDAESFDDGLGGYAFSRRRRA